MGKQTFDKTKKMLSILIVIFFVISITVAVVNAAPGTTDTKNKQKNPGSGTIKTSNSKKNSGIGNGDDRDHHRDGDFNRHRDGDDR
jgi:hypothetical protein